MFLKKYVRTWTKTITLKNLNFIFITLTFLFLSGCKKNNHNFQNQKTPEQLKTEALQKLREAIEKNPSLKKIKVPVGEQVEGYFADQDLSRITSRMDPENLSKGVVHGEYLIRHRNVMYGGCKSPFWSEEFSVEL